MSGLWQAPPCWRVPTFWEGETVFIVAGGPSLRDMDLSGLAAPPAPPVIVINDAYRLVPAADVLYFCDYKWFRWHCDAVEAWPNLVLTLAFQAAAACPSIHWLRTGPAEGLAESRDTLNTGRNSGFQAINLAVHAGAKRIVLIGYDMALGKGGASHWHDGHPGPPHRAQLFETWRPYFAGLAEPLRERGITVINATEGGALDCFARRPLDREIDEWRMQRAA